MSRAASAVPAGAPAPEDPVEAAYAEALAGSAAAFALRGRALAGGAAHDSWRLAPFPPVFRDGWGAWKSDVDGRQVVDFWMGHGALIAGHGFAPVVEAIRKQAERALHLGGLHEGQLALAERLCRLIPCAERVRFTASGSEATLLALRVARAATGRSTVLRFDGHYHGWHDEALARLMAADRAGLNPGVPDSVLVADPGDAEAAADLVRETAPAAVILEPGGGSSGCLPYDGALLAALRAATWEVGTVLIFDEVISAGRWPSGSVQAMADVTPDLATVAKIAFGGLPGGALVGSAAVLSVFDDAGHPGGGRVPHAGTFNGNPLSTAAGIAMLDAIADGEVPARADAACATLVEAINGRARARRVDVAAFRQSSVFHLVTGPHRAALAPEASPAVLRRQVAERDAHRRLRLALLANGVDMHPTHGWVSSAHDATALEAAVEAFDQAFALVADDPVFAA